MGSLDVPQEDNILMASFRALSDGVRPSAVDLVAAYGEHFQTAVAVPPTRTPVFERFSLVDPAVWMTARSSTAPD